jgi:hypothetical protein
MERGRVYRQIPPPQLTPNRTPQRAAPVRLVVDFGWRFDGIDHSTSTLETHKVTTVDLHEASCTWQFNIVFLDGVYVLSFKQTLLEDRPEGLYSIGVQPMAGPPLLLAWYELGSTVFNATLQHEFRPIPDFVSMPEPWERYDRLRISCVRYAQEP